MARAFHTLTLLAVAALVAGCSVDEAPAPSFTGPSELSTSLTLKANPDTLTQDGSSKSLVDVEARDAAGRALANVSLRFDVVRDKLDASGQIVGEEIVDFGVLETKSAATGSDGRAQVRYTAPPPPLSSPTAPPMKPSTVRVRATPTGANYANATPRSVEIRLIPAGTIYDPDTGPVAKFKVDGKLLPSEFLAARSVGVPVVCDASVSTSPAGLVSYAWDFGDGSTGGGVSIQHTFTSGGTYFVRLTVTDKKGQTAWVTNPVTVGAGPTAVFSWVQRPAPAVMTVDLDAGASWVVPPASFITSYAWDCGQGTQIFPSPPVPTNPRATCSFPRTGSFSVTLVVRDDKNGVGRLTQTITVQ